MPEDIKLGDIIELKKGHACGSNEWKIVRFGVDCKLECQGCGRIVMISRVDLKKKVKHIIKHEISGVDCEENTTTAL